MTRLDFRTTGPEPINWPARIAAHLDTLGPITARDVRILEIAAQGGTGSIHRSNLPRLLDLLRGARDATGRVTMDGQAALLAAVRGRL